MQPVLVTFRDIPHSAAVENEIRKKAEKLNRFYHQISSCRVVLEPTQKHKRQGKIYTARVDITVPGKELVANHHKNEDIYIAIRDAFSAIEKQLETYTNKKKGMVKKHEEVNKGKIKRILSSEHYGFIQGLDGTEYYFSSMNACSPDFDHLKVGDTVEFLVEYARDGMQAKHVVKIRHNNLVVQE